MTTLKRQEIYANTYRDLDHLRAYIVAFIEQYFNRDRLQSALGYHAPEESSMRLVRRTRRPEPDPRLGHLPDPLPEHGARIAMTPIVIGGPRTADGSAGASLTHRIRGAQICHHTPLPRGP